MSCQFGPVNIVECKCGHKWAIEVENISPADYRIKVTCRDCGQGLEFKLTPRGFTILEYAEVEK